MSYLEATVGKNTKRNLERACESGGCITVFPRSQYGTDLSREEFRDYLRWSLAITLHNLPCHAMAAATRLQGRPHDVEIGGG